MVAGATGTFSVVLVVAGATGTFSVGLVVAGAADTFSVGLVVFDAVEFVVVVKPRVILLSFRITG